jgi:hypothetical protein
VLHRVGLNLWGMGSGSPLEGLPYADTPFPLPLTDIICQTSRMRKLTATLCLTLAVLLFCAQANAKDYTIEEFLNGYRSGDMILKRVMEGDVAQMGHAFVSVNGFLKNQNKDLIYCPPNEKTFTGDKYIEIIRSYVGNNETLLKRKISNTSMLLLFALRKKYPC